jgi:hemerythrin-like metal-binding domain
MLYNWDKSLETGNAVIDAQHQQLIAELNRLIIANRGGEGQHTLENALNFLNGYAAQHSREEEALLRKYSFPKYKQHRILHENFRKSMHNLFDRMNVEGYTHALMDNTLSIMADRLIAHIKEEDSHLAAYIRQCESEE